MNVRMSVYTVANINSIFDHLHHGILGFDCYIHQGGETNCKHTHRMIVD